MSKYHTITVKVEKEMKAKMKHIRINWSDFIRESIKRRIELEEAKGAAEALLEDLKVGKHKVPKGFISKTIRELRERR